MGRGHYTHNLHDLCITQVDTEVCEQPFLTLSRLDNPAHEARTFSLLLALLM